MKKTLFLILICGLFLSACTSKEQDEKIHAFWQGQALKVASNPAVMDAMTKVMMRKSSAGMAGFSMGQDFNDEEMKKAMEALKVLETMNMNSVRQAPVDVQAVNEVVEIGASRPKQTTRSLPQTGENAMLVQALNAVKESNARTIQAYAFLTEAQQARIKEVMMETEEDLQDLVSKNADLDTFLNVQMNLMNEQERKINQILMEEISDRAE